MQADRASKSIEEQVNRLSPNEPDGEVIYHVKNPFKKTGGLRLLGGNLSPEFSAILKLAGVEGGLENGVFKGNAKVFDGEQSLLNTLDNSPESFANFDMVVVRYEGPVGGPGMPEMLDSTSRITTLCRERNIIIGLMTAGVMWRLCGFCGAKSTAKKTRGLLSLQWDESKEIRCHQGGLFYNSRPIRH